jgi:two-component system, NtrC family, nitrogen regulation sensor histidine kinase GlnL
VSLSSKAPALSAALARAVIDSIADAVLVVGGGGEVLHINPAGEELFGRSRERAVGLPVRALPAGTQLAGLAERARTSHEASVAAVPSPQDSGTVVSTEASPLFDGPSCAGTVLVLRIPRSNEHALDFEALAAGLAHEIKNPLAGLQGSAELLAREASGGARDYAQVIAREAKRVDGLVRELLDLARPAALQLVPLNVHSILEDVLVLARGMPGAERVRFVRRFDPSLPAAQADREKLTQVVLNLVRNALEAVAGAGGPEVVFETCVAPLRLRSASGRSCPLGRIALLDNGAGIPESMLPRLFTPFATSKAHGTGLGLAVSRRIIDAHGGRIEVKNRASGGVEATIYLPLETR